MLKEDRIMGEWTKGRLRWSKERAGRALVSESGRTVAAAHLLGFAHANAATEADANAQRIVDCWNAMLGIEDPAALMDEVRGVLKPFAEFVSGFDYQGNKKGVPDSFHVASTLTVGHLRAARALLAKIGGGE
jgi:hypothetical protein